MNNTIRAHLTVSFKAETHEFDALVDLDHCTSETGEPPNFHLHLARAAGVDPYSYLYEVLESHVIAFSEPTGVAALCCHDGQFDWPQFERLRLEDQGTQVIQAIADQILGVRDLDARADLKAALLAAYQAGKAAAA